MIWDLHDSLELSLAQFVEIIEEINYVGKMYDFNDQDTTEAAAQLCLLGSRHLFASHILL